MYRYALLASLTAMLTAGGAQAAAFALMEQNASGLGNAYAGQAAAAEDASTIHFNPAGLVYVDGRQWVLAGNLRLPATRFTNDGASSLSLGNGGDAGTTMFVPSAYLATDLTPEVKFGLGINTPFGLDIDYDAPWSGQTQAIASRIRTVNINPSLAWRVNPRLALGAGLNWQEIDAKLTRSLTAPAVTPATLKADDASPGWNLGLIWDVDGFTRLGLAYRSGIAHRLRGKLDGVPARLDIDLPDSLSLSLWHRLNPRWEILADLTRSGWSSYDRLEILRAADGVPLLLNDENWEDAWRLALGVNYRHSREWTWRLGVAYDETPVTDAQHRTPRIPDADRTWLAMGGQYRFGPHSAMDFGYAHVFVRDARIDHGENAVALRGNYQNRVDILGMQYTRGF